jgi:hypothetical protein
MGYYANVAHIHKLANDGPSAANHWFAWENQFHRYLGLL